MRVLLTADTEGGVWDYAVTLARSLHERGHEVLLGVVGERRDELVAHLPQGVEVAWRPYRLEWMPDAGDDVHTAGAWLAGISRLWAADVVHLNQMAYAAFGFHAPTLTVVHSDVVSWFRRVQGRSPGPEWRRYVEWVRAGLRASDLVVAPTAYQATLLEQSYGRSADRIIHNAVQAPETSRSGATGSLVLTVGRAWDEAKGIDVLDRALEQLGAAAPEAHLLGRTDGPSELAYRPRALITHGQRGRAEVDAWMDRASIYVAPARYEPFGLAPVEAALRGCALVLSDIGSFRELWDGCAMFFPSGNPTALAETIRTLVGDVERRRSLAEAAATRARRRYTAERSTTCYLEAYGAMLAGGSTPASVSRVAAAR
jgi:glycosyltransferase involved in cell wall biosynthesis